jgi:hypothetical protein
MEFAEPGQDQPGDVAMGADEGRGLGQFGPDAADGSRWAGLLEWFADAGDQRRGYHETGGVEPQRGRGADHARQHTGDRRADDRGRRAQGRQHPVRGREVGPADLGERPEDPRVGEHEPRRLERRAQVHDG